MYNGILEQRLLTIASSLDALWDLLDKNNVTWIEIYLGIPLSFTVLPNSITSLHLKSY